MTETKITNAQADKLLRLLADVWADQHGVKVKHISISEKNKGKSA